MQQVNFSVLAPQASGSNGVQQGIELASGVAKQQLQSAQTDVEKQRLADMQAASDKKIQMYQDLGMLAKDPNPKAVIALASKYPEHAQHFDKVLGMLDTQQKQVRVDQATQVYAAVLSGKPDIAAKLLRDQAQAYQNSGMADDAQSSTVLAGLVEQNPEAAAGSAGLFLARALGPDKFAEAFDKFSGERRSAALLPAQIAKGVAEADRAKFDAHSAGVTAEFARDNAIQDLEKKGWDVKKIQSEIGVAEFNKKIALANLRIEQQKANAASTTAGAAATNATTAMKKYELERDRLIMERGEKLRNTVANVSETRATIDNVLNTVDKVLNFHNDKPKVVESAHGPISARLPTTNQDTADYEALVNQIGSQAFISQVQALKEASKSGATGLGNLSEKEGDKIQAALGNLDLKQSPKQMKETLQEVQRIMLKTRSNLVTRFGLPDTVPDTPANKTGTNKAGKTMSSDDILKELGIIPNN